MSKQKKTHSKEPQLLHMVVGGELASLDGSEFRDLENLDVVGFYPDYKSAEVAWKRAAQKSVDSAMMRYFVIHLHRLLTPEATPAKRKAKARS